MSTRGGKPHAGRTPGRTHGTQACGPALLSLLLVRGINRNAHAVHNYLCMRTGCIR
jgi:hypothetical protein